MSQQAPARTPEVAAQVYDTPGGDAYVVEIPVADAKSGEKRRCSLCHSEDLRRTGKHAVTGKVIEPLAPSANPKRLTDPEHIEKWFTRNCKWTLGRECTPQEKGDFLLMIRSK